MIERVGRVMIALPDHLSLSIEHNEHKCSYQSVAEWIELRGDTCEIVDADEMIKTGEMWVVQWYPNTPVGFIAVAASTLDKAMEATRGGTEATYGS